MFTAPVADSPMDKIRQRWLVTGGLSLLRIDLLLFGSLTVDPVSRAVR